MELLHLLEEYGDQIEADLAIYAQTDLVDLYRGTLTYRKVAVLLRHGFPKTSATAKALNGGEEPWSLTDYLLSDLWALEVQKFKNPPKMHPWRLAKQRRDEASHRNSRRAKLEAAQRRRNATR